MQGVSERAQSRRGWAVVLATLVVLAFALWIAERVLVMPSVHQAQHIQTIDRALGATVETVGSTSAAELRAGHDPDDLIVTSVATGGPADQAGIRAGDVIDAVNGMSRETDSTLAASIGAMPIRMIINRHGEHVIVTLPAGTPPGSASRARR